MIRIAVITFSLLLLTACGSKSTVPASTSTPQVSQVGKFCADSAFRYIAQQLDFGPRVPGSEAQLKCAEWLQAELTRHGASVKVQRTQVTAYNGQRLPVINIVGSYNPDAPTRILILSHWDSRHIADNDPDISKRHLPVPAANDGASGVGIMLELARQASIKSPAVGLDLFFTDVEDYGAPDDWKGSHDESFWGMGTQVWCRDQVQNGYHATFGILLDMVGAPDATFYREYFSDMYASDVVNLVWGTARQMGYKKLFRDRRGGGITDDHVFVNRILGVPTIDIIDTRAEGNGTFYPYWHTVDDTLDKISTETLQAVGNVLYTLLW